MSDNRLGVALEAILCTEELGRRPSRAPNYALESRTMAALVRAIADSPSSILQTLADVMLDVFQCGSTGVSLLSADGRSFVWPAIAGVWRPHIGEGTPRDFSPCGDVLDQGRPLMFRHVEWRYACFLPVRPPVEEALLIPVHVDRQAIGTIWAVMHDDRRQFDREDLRMLSSLGTFAAAAYQAVAQRGAARERSLEREAVANDLRDMNEALLISSVRQHTLTAQAVQAEAKMSASEVRHRCLFESAKDGVVLLDSDAGSILDANPSFCELLANSRAALLGKQLWEIGLLPDKLQNEAVLLELKEKGTARCEHLSLQSTQGQKIEVEMVAVA